jgi:hypothetical protein
MNGSTAISDFENILENEKANYNCIKEKEVMESLNFYEKNKVEQSLYSFLNHRFFGIPFFLSAMFISFSLGFILFFLTILLFHSVGVTLVSWMFGTFLGIPLSFSLFEKVKVKAKNKYEVKWFKQMSQNIDGKHNFLTSHSCHRQHHPN